MLRRPPRSTLFPYTTSSDLLAVGEPVEEICRLAKSLGVDLIVVGQDRKSTRLNSSHSQISYAVFCLKKKNDNHLPRRRMYDAHRHSVYPAIAPRGHLHPVLC